MLVGLSNHERLRRGDRARGVAVLIADPHPGTRSALRVALMDAEAVNVVGEAQDLASAISAVSAAQIDIVLADARIAGLRSEAARAGLAQLSRRVPVVVMAMSDPRFYTVPTQAAGAKGYWSKDGDLGQLSELLRAAANRHPGPATVSDSNRLLKPS